MVLKSRITFYSILTGLWQQFLNLYLGSAAMVHSK